MQPTNDNADPDQGSAAVECCGQDQDSTTSETRTDGPPAGHIIRGVMRMDGWNRYEKERRKCVVCREWFELWTDLDSLNGRQPLASCTKCCGDCDCPYCGPDADDEDGAE